MKKLTFLFLFVTSLTYGQGIQKSVQRLIAPRTTDTGSFDQEFLRHGKEAIPYLINVIDTDRKGSVGYLNPMLSYIPPGMMNGRVGVRAAVMIELILGQRTNKSVYGYNIIAKNTEKIRGDVLELQDMKIIKSIYTAWWSKSKGKTINELRKDWKSGKRPLSGSAYHWI